MKTGNQDAPQAGVPLSTLFLAFLRLGCTAFGGPAMVAYIRGDIVERRKWVSDDSFRDGVALCQAIPGATAMQAVAYLGFRIRGVRGALASYAGFGLPAFLSMLVVSVLYGRVHEQAILTSMFLGLRVIVVALVANALLTFGPTAIRGKHDLLLACAAAALLGLGVAPFVVILGAAGAGLLIYARLDKWVGCATADSGLQDETKGKVRVGYGTAYPPGGTVFWGVAALAAMALGGVAFLFMYDQRLCELALMMIRIDLFALGGGYASLPLMLHEVVEARHWMDYETFMDGIALGQVTPGPIVITATFVGYRVAGFAGAVVGTAAIFTPSLLLLLMAVPYFDRLQRFAPFRRATRGALVSFVGLLLFVTVRFGQAAAWTWPGALIAVAAFVALRCRVDLLWVLLAGAAVSACVL